MRRMSIQFLILFCFVISNVIGCIEFGGHEVQIDTLPLHSFLKYATEDYSSFFDVINCETNPNNMRKNLKYYASIDHVAGTAEDYHISKFTRDEMRRYGFQSEIEPLKATLSYPINRSLTLLDSNNEVLYEAVLDEPVKVFDPSSDKSNLRSLSYLAYAASGEVKGQLIYANYGRPIDYEVLDKLDISVKGKIVIVRYGKCYRGLKIMNAERRGAIGVIIYSDPQEDGYIRGETYPKGKWRPEYSVQRGSAQFNSLVIGDPFQENVENLTGYASHELIPSIPAIPISYFDAIPFLKSLTGASAKDIIPDFVGGLKQFGVEYRLGPSQASVSLKVHNKLERRTIWNVISILKSDSYGTELDQPIVIGNHHDAWVFGAADPNSGSSLVLETARVLGLLKTEHNWKPKRSIIFGSWSGEEHGLIGSTGWAQKHKNDILKNAAVYLNVDIGVSGSVFLPATSTSLLDILKQSVTNVDNVIWNNKVGTPGSGSDYAVFLDNIGIPIMDLRFGNPGSVPPTYGTYHSIYDSYHYIESVVDPDFEYHTKLSKILSILAVRFAHDEILPINIHQQTYTLYEYIEKIEGLDEHLRQRLYNKAVQVVSAVDSFDNCNLSIKERNYVLGHFERLFIYDKGLPKRKHFKSILQSPGLYLGYAAEVFPGLVHEIRERNESGIEQQVKILMDCFENIIQKIKCQTYAADMD